ncbi:MAG: MopE-related protein [Myxococcota bacterium]
MLWSVAIAVALADDLCTPAFDPGVTCTPYATLSEAVDALQDGDTLWLDPTATYDVPVDVSGSGAYVIRGVGPAARARLVSQDGGSPVLKHSGSGDLTVLDVELEAEDDVGVVLQESGLLTLSNVWIHRDDPTDESDDVAIVVTGGRLDVVNGSLLDPWKTTAAAGHLLLSGGEAHIVGSTLTGGESPTSQGAGSIKVVSASLFLDGAILSGNRGTAGEGGGALYIRSGDATIIGSTFDGNTSVDTRGGGAIYLHAGTLDITGSEFRGNTTTTSGGAIRMQSSAGELTVVDTVFEGNSAQSAGGAVSAIDGVFTSSGTRWAGNQSASNGGGLHAAGIWSSTDDTFCANTAMNGAGVYFSGTSGETASLENPAFVRNLASVGGGGLTRGTGDLLLDHGTFIGNSASSNGSAARFSGTGAITVRNTLFLRHVGIAVQPLDGTWTRNAWLENETNWSGTLIQSNEVLSGDPWIHPNPPCDRAMLAPGSPSSVLVGAGTSGSDIGAIPFTSGDSDGDGWHGGSDCAPTDASAFPGAPLSLSDVADGVDADCSGRDECAVDADGDTFGALVQDDAGEIGCLPSDGESAVGGDCDDTTDEVFPGAPVDAEHVGDGLDRDCDGLDECYVDEDGDLYGSDQIVPDDGDFVCAPISSESSLPGDCADLDANVFPMQAELCNGIDDDCDGLLDDDDPDVDAQTWYPDDDGDGYGSDALAILACSPPVGHVQLPGDCSDDDPAVSPASPEACPDGVDNDCDGLVDDEDPDYTDMPAMYWYDDDGDGAGVSTNALLVCSDGVLPGYVPAAVGEDCDDTDPTLSPLQSERCDSIDNDCDGEIDEGFTTTPSFADVDGDGYGNPLDRTDTCTIPGDRVTNDRDCDDLDASVSPDAVEVCDGVDNDCDDAVDEGFTPVLVYDDADGDGFGDPASERVVCDPPSGLLEVGGDCDDSDPAVNPGAVEVCDAVDRDCDGDVLPDGPCTVVTGCRCEAGTPPGLGVFGLLALLLATRRRHAG